VNPLRDTIPVLLCGLLAGCGPDPLEQAVEGAVSEAIVPAIEDFDAEATELRAGTATFCANPDETELRALQDRWLSTMLAWNQAGVYRLGPLDDDPIVPTINLIESKRQRGTDYTQTVRETIAAAMDSGEALDEAYFRDQSFNRTGLLALEVLLFEDAAEPPSNAPSDIVAAYAVSPRRCAYLRGTAAVLSERASGVVAGWSEGFGEAGVPYRDQLLEPTLADGSEPALALLVAAIEHIRYLRIRKLEAVADVQSAQAARPDADPFFSGLEAGALQLEALFTAQLPGGPSLLDVMENRGFMAEAEALRLALLEVQEWAREANEAQTIGALQELEFVLTADVPDALGVVLPLNFNDGD
jgi:predicted lipoprotein